MPVVPMASVVTPTGVVCHFTATVVTGPYADFTARFSLPMDMIAKAQGGKLDLNAELKGALDMAAKKFREMQELGKR